MARWYVFRGAVRLPGIIEQPDRPSALHEAEQRHGWAVTVRSVVDYEIGLEEDAIIERHRRLRMQWTDEEDGS